MNHTVHGGDIPHNTVTIIQQYDLTMQAELLIRDVIADY